MNRRQFLLAFSAIAATSCGRRPVPFGGSPQAPNSDADRIREDLEWRAEIARVHSRDWIPPDTKRTVPPPFDFAAAVPELADKRRPAVLLHPRYSDEPPTDGSKVGGIFLWPTAETWPVCDVHPASDSSRSCNSKPTSFPKLVSRLATTCCKSCGAPGT